MKIAVNDRPAKGEIGSWTMRRRFMWVISIFCMWSIAYVLIKGQDTRVAETSVMCAFLCLGSIVGSYVFGAAWQDIRSTEALSKQKE